MATYVYAHNDASRPVGILEGDRLYDNSHLCVIACSDSRGLYTGPIPTGTPDYVIHGNDIKEMHASRSLFTIRGNGICDGNGSMPTFWCPQENGDVRLALALTAIAYVGDLRMRPSGADVVPASSYSFFKKGPKCDQGIDYSVVNGDYPDPFSNRQVPESLKGQYDSKTPDPSHFKNVTGYRNPPERSSGCRPVFPSPSSSPVNDCARTSFNSGYFENSRRDYDLPTPSRPSPEQVKQWEVESKINQKNREKKDKRDKEIEVLTGPFIIIGSLLFFVGTWLFPLMFIYCVGFGKELFFAPIIAWATFHTGVWIHNLSYWIERKLIK